MFSEDLERNIDLIWFEDHSKKAEHEILIFLVPEMQTVQ